MLGRGGTVQVVNEGVTTRSTIQHGNWFEVRPERKFSEQRYLINHDPRVTLSEDTYVQLTMGSGIKVKIPKHPEAEKKLNQWKEDIDLDIKLENGLHSYFGQGQMIFEKYPKLANVIEVNLNEVDRAMRSKEGDLQGIVLVKDFSKETTLRPDEITWFRLTEVNREIFGRGMYHAIITQKEIDGDTYDSPLEALWKIEDAMKKIFQSYASPIMMIHFKDAGEEFIKQQKIEFEKLKPGAKILTDKEFEVKVFEVNPASKFDKYIEHLQNDVMEPGVQFPIQYFNAGFTARAASETTDDAMIRKVKRIQRRLGTQLKREWFMPYLELIGFKEIPSEDVDVVFEIDTNTDVSVQDVEVMFEKGVLVRNEVRDHLKKNTTLQLDSKYDGNTPPITSVTPTNDLTKGDKRVWVRGTIKDKKLEVPDDEDDIDANKNTS